MAGVLSGLKVLDLSWGIAGPAAAMLLADNGAAVTRIERPEGDPFEGYLDYRTYSRGKRSAVLDLKDPADRERFLALAADADVVIESFAPGVADRLGIGYGTLAARNPRLVYGAVSAYGKESPEGDRPGFDQLVAARTGYQWEVRAWPGTPTQAAGGEEMLADPSPFSTTTRWYLDRTGPVFTATPAPSINAAYLLALGISAALRSREVSGRGQRVDTSLLQGIVGYQLAGWQRTEVPPATPPSGMEYSSSITLMCNAVIFRCADGWVNMWGGNTEWAKLAAAGDELVQPDPEEVRARARAAMEAGRGGGLESRLEAAESAAPFFAKFPVADWVRIGHQAQQALQPVRSPEEALTDSAFLAEGCVAQVDDPDLGPILVPGLLYRLHGAPGEVGRRVPRRGQHTAEVRAEGDALMPGDPVNAAGPPSPTNAAPLAGIRALDFGVAVAGPWGGELLAQLGAEVIKIDPEKQRFWLANAMAMGVNRSKQHLIADMKHPDGLAAIHELVKRSDIVLMNIRPQAADKLGLDYESLKKVNPRLIYCHTRGNDLTRAHLPSNDQQGNALGGAEWEDGGVHNGGKPYWSCASGGDLGDGALSAIAMVQALYHRDRTGEGQWLDTSIVNASLFSNGRIYTDPSGARFERPTLDRSMLGLAARYRLYRCDEGWLCLAAFSDRSWHGLCSAIPSLADDPRFATEDDRRANDAALAAALEHHLAGETAEHWFKILDEVGVPCEVSSPRSCDDIFDDPDLVRRGIVASRDGHPRHGRIDMFGKLIDFSETPVVVGGPPPVAGQHTRRVLSSLAGYTEEQIDGLIASGAIGEASV